MADYKTIHGINIRDYTTDPDNLLEGQVWFDKTAVALQFQAAGAGSWASGGNMNTARDQIGGAGTQTSALAFGGRLPSTTAVTELWNGTNWTEVNNMPGTAVRANSGFGTQAAAASAGATPH